VAQLAVSNERIGLVAGNVCINASSRADPAGVQHGLQDGLGDTCERSSGGQAAGEKAHDGTARACTLVYSLTLKLSQQMIDRLGLNSD
jgi:hypothetical protein